MRINIARLQESMQQMARIGATPAGGVTRLALSDEDRAARDLFVSWLRQAGLDVCIDDIGNIYGWRPGFDPDLPPALMGSHLDTVRRGGRFDGALGVLGALEVIRSLNDAGSRTRRTLGIVSFTNEEGARFEWSLLGSQVMTGARPLAEAYALTDRPHSHGSPAGRPGGSRPHDRGDPGSGLAGG